MISTNAIKRKYVELMYTVSFKQKSGLEYSQQIEEIIYMTVLHLFLVF